MERFVVNWIAGEKAKAALQYAVECPNVTARAKEMIVQSKHARAGLLGVVD